MALPSSVLQPISVVGLLLLPLARSPNPSPLEEREGAPRVHPLPSTCETVCGDILPRMHCVIAIVPCFLPSNLL